jgi:drug/metabolite transporter (DMT)-like permease
MKGAAVPALFILLFLLPVPSDLLHLPWAFWWPLLIIWFVLYPIQIYFLFRSIREGELSEVVPVLSLQAVFNIVSSYYLIGEVPSWHGFLGIAAIVAGVYTLLTEKRSAPGSGAPSHGLNMPILYMVIASICMAIGTSLDKLSLEVSTPALYSFVNTLGAAILFFFLALLYGQGRELRKIPSIGWLIAWLGIINGILYLFAMFALTGAPTSYSLAVRSGSFIFAALWGILVLKEIVNLRKGIAFALFLVGTVALAIG